MTMPQFDDTPSENIGGDKRDSSEFIPWTRVAEVKTPRGTRPGLTLIVRPLERIPDYRDKTPGNEWKTLVIADIAVLDPIPPGADEYGMMLDPIAPGSQWRNQTVFPGMLNKAWRDKIGNTLIGVVYVGEARPTAQGTMGKPPFLWRSLSQDPQQTARGQRFFVARREFLIPVPRQVATPTAADPGNEWGQAAQQQPDPWSQPLAQPAPQYQQDPWAHSQGHPAAIEQQYAQAPQYQQQPPQGYAQPVSAAPQGNPYQQPDPWASQLAQPVPHGQHPIAPVAHGQQGQQAPVQQAQPHPGQGMNTLEQIKMAQQQAQQQPINHQGQPQAQDPPF